MWSPIASRRIQPSLMINTDSLRNDSGRNYVNNRMLGFEIHETVENVFVEDRFVFFTHVPSTIRTVLAGFHLEEHWLTVIKKVDQDVNL